MKKSEKLDHEARSTENDFKAWGIHKKAHRERKLEKFQERWEPFLKADFEYEFDAENVCYKIKDPRTRQFEWGFYPKSGKLFIRSGAKWVTKGLDWMIQNLIGRKARNFKREYPIASMADSFYHLKYQAPQSEGMTVFDVYTDPRCELSTMCGMMIFDLKLDKVYFSSLDESVHPSVIPIPLTLDPLLNEFESVFGFKPKADDGFL